MMVFLCFILKPEHDILEIVQGKWISRKMNVLVVVVVIKSLRNKKGLNDVTATPFSACFLLLAAEKKTMKTGQL